MSFTNLIRQRQNGQKNRTRNVLRQDAIDREFDAYKGLVNILTKFRKIFFGFLLVQKFK